MNSFFPPPKSSIPNVIFLSSVSIRGRRSQSAASLMWHADSYDTLLVLYLKGFLSPPPPFDRCELQPAAGPRQSERRAGQEHHAELQDRLRLQHHPHAELLGPPPALGHHHLGRLQPPGRDLHPPGVRPPRLLRVAVRPGRHHRHRRSHLRRHRDVHLQSVDVPPGHRPGVDHRWCTRWGTASHCLFPLLLLLFFQADRRSWLTDVTALGVFLFYFLEGRAPSFANYCLDKDCVNINPRRDAQLCRSLLILTEPEGKKRCCPGPLIHQTAPTY